tara:strand:- start:399 stop:599 length:201 start_codon:yes stop_codon:yes gene_type:complete
MKFLVLFLALLFNVKTTLSASFVDSLAKEYGKENGCYSISLKDKKTKTSYIKSYSDKKPQELKKDR